MVPCEVAVGDDGGTVDEGVGGDGGAVCEGGEGVGDGDAAFGDGDWSGAARDGGAVVEDLRAAAVPEEDAEVGLGVIDAGGWFCDGLIADADGDLDPIGVGGVDGGPVEFDFEATFCEDGGAGFAGGEVPPVGEVGGVVEADAAFGGGAEESELIA